MTAARRQTGFCSETVLVEQMGQRQTADAEAGRSQEVAAVRVHENLAVQLTYKNSFAHSSM